MVNLDKWEKIEHDDVKVGDRLKIVIVTTALSPVKQVEVYKGKVTLIRLGDFYLDDGSVWEDVDPTERETCTVYRRKSTANPFKLPVELGAIISGVQKGRQDGSRIWLVFDGADWACNFNTYIPSRIESIYEDLRVERKGIKIS